MSAEAWHIDEFEENPVRAQYIPDVRFFHGITAQQNRYAGLRRRAAEMAVAPEVTVPGVTPESTPPKPDAGDVEA